MERVPIVTRGEILREEFLVPTGISGYQLAKVTHMPATRVAGD
jgi:plasmid maintenance system antidote protein VapI